MGEYWKPVNVSRREYVDPHKLGSGAKLPEWNFPGSVVIKRVEELLASGQWSPADDIRIASDYGQEMQMYGYPGDIQFPPEDDEHNLWHLAYDEFSDVTARTPQGET